MKKTPPGVYTGKLCRQSSKLKDVKMILQDIMLKETNSHYFE